MMPPDAEATIVETMGRSQAAVIVERREAWTDILDALVREIGI
jgi:hypothetical protein